MNLFNLIAKLTLDNSEYENGLADSEKAGSKFSVSAKKVFKGVATAATAVVAVVTAAAVAFKKLASDAINYADEIDKSSQKLGLSASSYQVLALAAQMAGAEVTNLQMGIRQMSMFAENLAKGNADAANAIKKLGLNQQEFLAMDTEKRIFLVINALQGMTDQMEKATVAQEIFGARTYMELMPLLNQEQGSVEELGEQYKKLGIVISDDVVKNGAVLNDEITVMQATFRSLTATVISEAFPAISTFIGGLQDLAIGAETAPEKIAQGVLGIVDMVVNSVPRLLGVLDTILIDAVGGLLNDKSKLISQLLSVIETILIDVVAALPEIIASAGDIIDAVLRGVMELDWVTLIVQILDTVLIIATQTLPNIVFKLLNTIFDIFSVGNGFKILKQLGKGIAQILVNAIVAGFEGAINVIIGAINTLTGAVSKLWTWAGAPEIPEIPKVSFPRIALMKNGGMFEDIISGRGTTYAIAGESGAEIVSQGSQGTGVTNVKQFSDAMLDALERFFGRNPNVVLRVGDKDLDAYIINSVNGTLRAQGRKTLYAITR